MKVLLQRYFLWDKNVLYGNILSDMCVVVCEYLYFLFGTEMTKWLDKKGWLLSEDRYFQKLPLVIHGKNRGVNNYFLHSGQFLFVKERRLFFVLNLTLGQKPAISQFTRRPPELLF